MFSSALQTAAVEHVSSEFDECRLGFGFAQHILVVLRCLWDNAKHG